MSSKDLMFAKVILASKPTNGAPPIVTMHLRYPRIIHSELMTHRVFSRNARSSRAVPAHKMLLEVTTAPFIPWHWGKNQPGMQAGEDWNALVDVFNFGTNAENPDDYDGIEVWSRYKESVSPEEAWLKARDAAVEVAEAFMKADYHKQIVNRLLEPFMFIDVLVTSTQWANFRHLRDHKDAEPHIKDLAILVGEALDNAEYQTLEKDEWHLPYITLEDRFEVRERVGSAAGSNEAFWAMLLKLSTARCARISYTPFDGDASYERELQRYGDLVGSEPLHASPAEHQAKQDVFDHFGHMIEDGFSRDGIKTWEHSELAGNLGAGWIQHRKILPNEYVPG